MTDSLRLAAAAVELGMGRYVRGEANWTAESIALLVVSVTCAAGASGFAVAAFLIYLIPRVGASGAALMVAGTLVAIGAISAGVAQYLRRPLRRRDMAPPPDLESLLTDAEGFVRDHKGLMLSAAFVAGILSGDETSRRRQD